MLPDWSYHLFGSDFSWSQFNSIESGKVLLAWVLLLQLPIAFDLIFIGMLMWINLDNIFDWTKDKDTITICSKHNWLLFSIFQMLITNSNFMLNNSINYFEKLTCFLFLKDLYFPILIPKWKVSLGFTNYSLSYITCLNIFIMESNEFVNFSVNLESLKIIIINVWIHVQMWYRMFCKEPSYNNNNNNYLIFI